MSIAIGNNIGVNHNYKLNINKSSGKKSVHDYASFLMNKYSCLAPGKNVAVSVTPGMLQKAMTDEETGKWLERELTNAPKYIAQAQQSASARGCRLVSAAIEFGEEYTTMYTCVVTDTEGTDSNIDKWLERVKEDKEEKKALEKKAEKKAAKEKSEEKTRGEYSYTFKGKDLKAVTDNFIEKLSVLGSEISLFTGLDITV